MELSLKGKRALVGGSTQGIGLAIATELALLGASCTLMARNEDKLKLAIASLDQSQGQQHEYIVADYFDYNLVATQVQQYTQSKAIHILINNSGGPAGGPITAATPEQFLTTFQQHLICNQVISQAVLPSMQAANYGRIINIISTSVKIPLKGLGVSNTIRGAVASWAKTLSNEVAKFGITVNNILPGATATSRLEQIINNKANNLNQTVSNVEEEMTSEIPMQRFGQAQEIAAVAAFIASPAASYLTGTSIPVDGGRTGSI